MERELDYLGERLDGLQLESERDQLDRPVRLERFRPPAGKFIAEDYLGESKVWETVTPVILDECNRKSKADKPDAIARQTERLICKALGRAGIETPCEFSWQALPFFKNTLSAHKYDKDGNRTGYFRPEYLQGRTAAHMRIQFPVAVPGPMVIGAGRHCGFGLFAAASGG